MAQAPWLGKGMATKQQWKMAKGTGNLPGTPWLEKECEKGEEQFGNKKRSEVQNQRE